MQLNGRPFLLHSFNSLWAGLVAFELPLAYIYSDKFNQPIFGANNLSGELQQIPGCIQTILKLCKLTMRGPLCLWSIEKCKCEPMRRKLLASCTTWRSCR